MVDEMGARKLRDARNSEHMIQRTDTMASFSEDWHGVPAGTEVRILGECKDIAGFPVLRVTRLDGLDLPSPWGTVPVAHVDPKYID